MRKAPTAIVLACVCLLGVQLAGVHMHVEAGGFSGGPHGTHVHGASGDGHDHDGERDVAIVELGGAAAKLLLFFATFVLTILCMRQPARVSPPLFVPPIRSGRRGRWRPPLRAPPTSPRIPR